MTLRDQITSQSWMEDMQFVILTCVSDRPHEVARAHVVDYLDNRYTPSISVMAEMTVQAAWNWIARNWEELGELGLRQTGGLVNAVLFALHNLVFHDPRPEAWGKVPDVPLAQVVKDLQEFVDAGRSHPSSGAVQPAGAS